MAYQTIAATAHPRFAKEARLMLMLLEHLEKLSFMHAYWCQANGTRLVITNDARSHPSMGIEIIPLFDHHYTIRFPVPPSIAPWRNAFITDGTSQTADIIEKLYRATDYVFKR